MTNAEKEKLTLKEALDNLYVLATYNKSNGWNEGFYEECLDRVNVALHNFFEKPVKPTLTEDEKVILRNISKKYKYIYRGAVGLFGSAIDLYVSTKRPFVRNTDYRSTEISAFNHLFQFIQPRRRI